MQAWSCLHECSTKLSHVKWHCIWIHSLQTIVPLAWFSWVLSSGNYATVSISFGPLRSSTHSQPRIHSTLGGVCWKDRDETGQTSDGGVGIPLQDEWLITIGEAASSTHAAASYGNGIIRRAHWVIPDGCLEALEPMIFILFIIRLESVWVVSNNSLVRHFEWMLDYKRIN